MRRGEGDTPIVDSSRIEWPEASASPGWFDLTGDPRPAPKLHAALAPSCPGMSLPMLEDLSSPDERPTEVSFEDASVKLASTFAVRCENPARRQQRGEPIPAGLLVIQPVELLAGDGWLATCWHPTRAFYGNHRQGGDGNPAGPGALIPSLRARWSEARHRSAGDLGALIMSELALTYDPALRTIASWLEDWQLGFYVGDERFTDQDLAGLWGFRALLRDWLAPLLLPGAAASSAKAWLPDVSRDLAVELDGQISGALAAVDRLGDSLRSSFSLLHIQQTERSREATESLQRRIEIAAAAFLVPTLIVGFYGANTWVPGERTRWGFWVMVAALIAFTGLTVTLLVVWQRKQARDRAWESAEQARIRAEVLKGD